MHLHYDLIVVGAGFAGLVTAERAAFSGRRVLLLERKMHIGGHCRDHLEAGGIRVHDHGPHIFHTGQREVWNYLSRFTQWYPYRHKVRALVDGQLIPLPFNLNSIDMCFNKPLAEEIRFSLTKSFPHQSGVPVLTLKASTNPALKALGNFVYEKVFLNYTRKQWGGRRPEELDASVSARVPVRLNRNDEYFTDNHQGIPAEGYANLFEALILSPRISLKTGVNAATEFSIEEQTLLYRGEPCRVPVVYTGMVDELCGYLSGKLPYRSLTLEAETFYGRPYQGTAVVNYPNEETFTRITEYRHFMEHPPDGISVIHREYPETYRQDENDPYYIVPGVESEKTIKFYQREVAKVKNLHLLGRLGEYKYYNMDEVVNRALNLSKELFK